jgi:hypothetical protein
VDFVFMKIRISNLKITLNSKSKSHIILPLNLYMAPKHVNNNSTSEAHSVGNPPRSRQEPPHLVNPEEQEVNQHEERGETSAPPPPPHVVDLVQVMHNQTLLMDALNNAVNRPRPRMQSLNEKLTEFFRNKTPTFGKSINPLEADDLLRVIQRKLEPYPLDDGDTVLLATHRLIGTALAWWENYSATTQDASTITWKQFVDGFCCYHIPAATMKCKADEFRELTQGNKSVEEYTYQFLELARYAPEEVDKDAKKQDMFKNSELCLLLRSIHTSTP